MSGNDLALDTSAAIKLLNDAPFAACFLATASKIYLPAIAAGELLYGARNSSRHIINLPRYRQFIDQCVILPVSAAVADRYSSTRLALKVAGFPIPEADVWIAATALDSNLPLATSDQHFSHVSGLSTVWI